MKKVGKKINLNKYKNYKVHFGTMDRLKSNSLYISISTWANPKVETTVDYEKIVRKLNKRISAYIYNNIDKNLFDNKFAIVDLDLRTSGIRYDKRSFMNCDITLYKKTNASIEDSDIDESVHVILDGVIKDVLNKSEYFSFHKTKK
jgi:hypothetical protein